MRSRRAMITRTDDAQASAHRLLKCRGEWSAVPCKCSCIRTRQVCDLWMPLVLSLSAHAIDRASKRSVCDACNTNAAIGSKTYRAVASSIVEVLPFFGASPSLKGAESGVW